jgi:cell division protein FtsQ
MNGRAPEARNNRRLPKAEVEELRARASWDPDALWRNLRVVGRVMLGFVVLGVGVGAAIAARRYVTQSPQFGLRDLKIEGLHRHSEAEVRQTAGLALGQNVVEIDLDAVRAKLERDPWIERATVTRKLPASLAIEIVEREAAAIVALPNGAYLATAEGVAFKRMEDGDPVDLPVVTGVEANELSPLGSEVAPIASASANAASVASAPAAGPNLVGAEESMRAQLVRRALDLAAEAERVGVFGGRVQELHVEPDGGITASLGKRAVRVSFGKTSFRAKVRLAAKIEAELARRGARPTWVFLDDDAHPDRVVVRLVRSLPSAEVTVDEEPGKKPANGKAQKLAKKGKP